MPAGRLRVSLANLSEILTGCRFYRLPDEVSGISGQLQSRSNLVLIEEETPGVDTRFYFIKGEIAAVAVRVPPFVVGDGAQTIRQLVNALRDARSRHAYLMNQSSVMVNGDFLATQGLNESSVLEHHKVALLNGTANMRTRGLSLDITSSVHGDLMSIAKRAGDNLLGFGCGAIDLLAVDPVHSTEAVVLEINAHVDLLVNQHSTYGDNHPVAEKIIHAMTA